MGTRPLLFGMALMALPVYGGDAAPVPPPTPAQQQPAGKSVPKPEAGKPGDPYAAAVGLWAVPDEDSEEEAFYPRKDAFSFDGETMTLELLPDAFGRTITSSTSSWRYREWRSPDDCYRLKTKWLADGLYYLAPVGGWVWKAEYQNGALLVPRDGRMVPCKRVPKDKAPENLRVLLQARKTFDCEAAARASSGKERGRAAAPGGGDSKEPPKRAADEATGRPVSVSKSGDEITNGIGMKFIRIPPGEFLMGSPETEKERQAEERQHKVRISKAFYIASTEVTQAQWHAVLGKGAYPSCFMGETLPADNVDWDLAVYYCQELSKKSGLHYRLPTEAEWECACRAGTTRAFHTGDTAGTDKFNYCGVLKFGSFTFGRDRRREGIPKERTTPVGSYKPNPWGLYDMHGNVAEWCQDRYGPYPESKEVLVDPKGPPTGEKHVLRGGFWDASSVTCRSAFRLGMGLNESFRPGCIGFRVVLDWEPAKEKERGRPADGSVPREGSRDSGASGDGPGRPR